MTSFEGYARPDPVPWWRRALRRIFPYAMPPQISELHGVRSHVHVHLDWRDRLRALVSGHVLVVVAVDTERDPGRPMNSRVAVCVLAPGEPT